MAMMARYERTFMGTWNLVVYHDGVPGKSSNGERLQATEAREVPTDLIHNGEPRLKAIELWYPAPQE